MLLPQSLQNAIEDASNYVQQHPDHEYHPEKRRELLTTLMNLGTVGAKTRGWLASVTGKRLLPF